jgi:hypothetical protein
MNFNSAGANSKIQALLNTILSGGTDLRDAQGVIAETLVRVADDSSVSFRSFIKELDVVTSSMENIQLKESVVGARKYSAKKAGITASIPEQMQSRGAAGAEEVARANVAAEAVYKEYEKMGVSSSKLNEALQIDRAHIIEVTNAQKRYGEAWEENTFVVQTHAENELSQSLTYERNQKAYLTALSRVDATEQQKALIADKITKNLALTEDELQIQAKVLQEMLADTALMKTTSAGLETTSRGVVAAAKARAEMGPASAGVGSRNLADVELARQKLLRATYRGNLTFVKKLKFQGQAGLDEMFVAMEKKAETRSASRRTRRLGNNIVDGISLGMKDRESALKAQTQRVADIATLSKTSLYGTTGGVDPVQKSIRRQLDKRAKLSQIQQGMAIGPNVMGMMGQTTKKPSVLGRLKNINPMKASMGLMGVGMAGSMLPGKAGQVAGQATGAAFVAQALMMLPGPLKLVAGGLAAAYGLMKIANYFRQKEIDAIEGVGKAANLTSGQLDKLGEVLGFTPLKSNLENAKPAVSGLTTEQSKQVEETRKLLATDKEFKAQVKTLSAKDKSNNFVADQKTTDIVFKSLALRLAGQGATKDAIKTYIYALQQEAGRTDVKFDLKSIDLTTKEGRAGLQSSVDTLLKDYKTAFNKGYKKTKMSVTGGAIVNELEVVSKDLKKNLSTVSNVLQNTFIGLDTQLRSGIINADQFTKSFDGISASIKAMPKPDALFLMSNLMKSLPSELVKAAAGVKNLSDQMLLLQAGALGLRVTESMIKTLAVEGSNIAKNRVTDYLKNGIKDLKLINEAIGKAFAAGTKTGTGEKGPTNMEKYNKAYAIIKNFFDSQEALIRRQRKSEADLLQKKIDNAQKEMDLAQEKIDKQQEVIDLNNREVDLLNRKIELNYDRPIQKLQDESTILNNNLEIIRKQEDGINKQYDAQIDALEKISSLNQELATQEKSRLTIADAITQGDISAAAVAIQEARAASAAARIDQQKKAMEASRQAALTGLTAGGMTKDQIEARTYQIGQQTFLLEQQKKVLQDQITVIQDKNYATEQQIYKVKQDSLIPSQKIVDHTSKMLKDYNETTDKIVASVKYLGQTAEAWEANRIKIEAANAQLEFTKNNVQAAKTAAEGILAAWKQIDSKVITIKTIYETSGAPTKSKTGMYGGKINPMSMGGIVPKYFASGGRIGSDSVPTMLTPGEFVVNRAASKRFGPLLESLNESKYPSMIGAGSSGYGAPINNVSSSVSDNSTAVYNYSLGFNVNESNSNANDIAKAVMREIKNVDAQRIRGQRR